MKVHIILSNLILLPFFVATAANPLLSRRLLPTSFQCIELGGICLIGDPAGCCDGHCNSITFAKDCVSGEIASSIGVSLLI